MAWLRINKKSLDIVGGVHVGRGNLDVGTGDFGTVFRWAAVETEEAMPLIFFSLGRFLPNVHKKSDLGWRALAR